MITLLTSFARAVEKHPNEPLFRDSKGTMTYAQAALVVAHGVEQLRGSGLKPGDRAICFTDETIPLALLILTTGLAGVIPAAISPIFSSAYIKSLFQQSRAHAILTTPDYLGVTRRTAGPDFAILQYDAHEGFELNRAGSGLSLGSSATFVRGDIDDVAGHIEQLSRDISLDDALLIQPTSGSTGAPKLVLRTHRAFSRYAAFVGDEVEKGLGPGRFRMLLANAMTHAFACHMFAVGLRFAAEIIVPSALDTNASLGEVRAFDPDVLTMTPRILRSFVRQQESGGDRPGTALFGKNARLLLSAGGRADPQVVAMLRGQGLEALELYGSSEASIVALTPYRGWRGGRAGQPVSDVDLKFSAQKELLVKSPGMMSGYFGDSELTDLVRDEDGYYRTGDLARLDEDGYLEILGRRRDVFNTPEGSNVYPERIEILLESQRSIRQAFLVGDGRPFVTAHLVVDPGAVEGLVANTDELGEFGMLLVERNAKLYETLGEIVAKLNAGLELLEQPVALALYIQPFPDDCYRAASGKVQRTRVRFQERFARPIDLLYGRLMPRDSLMLVPPRERRFASRVDGLIAARGDGPRRTSRPPPT